MSRSESNLPKPSIPFDWRSWLILAWVVWFGVQYARMVVEKRGGKLNAMVHFHRDPQR